MPHDTCIGYLPRRNTMSTRSLLAAVADPIEVAMPSPAPAAEPSPRRRPAAVVAGSLLAGLPAAVALVAGPRAGGGEAAITGGLLLGFAAGWALLAGALHRPPAALGGHSR